MPTPTWKKHQKEIADANQRNRKLLNEMHALEMERDLLREQIVMLTQRADEAEAKTMRVAYDLADEQAKRTKEPRHRPLLDLELRVLSDVCALEALPETPSRRKVIDRIVTAICGDS
jgi:septal ring factor EnvC (AmiA/AmiB activator)